MTNNVCKMLEAPSIGVGIDVENIDVETWGLGGLDSQLSLGQPPRFLSYKGLFQGSFQSIKSSHPHI